MIFMRKREIWDFYLIREIVCVHKKKMETKNTNFPSIIVPRGFNGYKG